MKTKLCSWILIGSIGAAGGCANKMETGALVGAGGGAAAGGLIGSNSHARAGEGALIGAGVGALAGGLIGHGMDESDKKKDRDDSAGYEYDRHHDSQYAGSQVQRRDVIRWTQRGTRDDVIIDRIERSGSVFHLSAADEQDLRNAGVSEMVIQDMKATAQR